ncbi:presqualene diphosphate synthase HpnD [Pseudogulbenkiania subflava]|uniref:Farnesyl-diphosphate farnesyltransferase n=1 Tax=Pseudogulbenkiania subflava DSM 22618 TaxID=1123014 RepID=A0A1Y6C5J9_9NEIS|nr:presqualene diphosphate synthase HpnD [Pseudogulbenkiania subflava]SMF46887.1 farnesyl-diphosphate farnesyltransferase [Pseudogulbenkiania subflava DSM 22618]
MTPDQYCQDKAASSGSSFYYSFRFLAEERRRAITALYAFCREVDDVVDECHDENVARTKLAWWRAELVRLYAGQPQHPVTQALQPHVAAYGLPQKLLEEIVDGMEMDLDFARYDRFADLLLYCHRAAGVVGQLSAQIFGYTDQHTLKYAHELGVAFQLTNIIRDVGEDARRGRIYLPVEELRRFNVPASDIQNYRETEAFRQLMDFQIERAEQYYRQAWEQLPKSDVKAQRPGLLMAAIYRATLTEIKLDGPQKVLNQRLSLTPIRKLWLAWKTWVFGYQP